MLMVTQTAAEAIDAVVASAPVSDDGGIRISQPEGEGGFTIAVVDAPPASDTVLDMEGEHAPVFMDPEAADALDDKVLDAQLQDGQVSFVLAEQA